METTFDQLVYESDESNGSKGSSTMSGRSRRKSSRVTMIKSESVPTRRSGRLQMRHQSAEDDKDKSMNFMDGIPQPSKSGAKAKDAKPSTLDHQVDQILGATTVDGQLKFCIRLQGEKNPILISAEEAKQKYTYHVLDFYESCLVWESEEEGEDLGDDGDNNSGAGNSTRL